MGVHILRTSHPKHVRNPEQRIRRDARNLRIAYVAQFLSFATAVALLVYGAIGQSYYWGAPTALSVMGFILVTLFVGFIAVLRRSARPSRLYAVVFWSTLVLFVAGIAVGGSVH